MATPIRLLSPRTATLAVRGLSRRPASTSYLQTRPAAFHTSSPRSRTAHNNETPPDQAPTTDFGRMDVLANTPAPATSIDACAPDGFSLGGGSVEIGGGSGALLIGGEAFIWRPWDVKEKKLINKKGQWEVPNPTEAFGLFGSLWPRPGMF